MANAPLNPPLGTNNLLALCLQKVGNIKNYVDTGEPAVSTATTQGNYIVVTAAATAICTFPLNGAGFQPTVSQGAYAIQVEAYTGTSLVVGPIIIEACDSTATNAGNVEVVDIIPVFPLLTPLTICRDFNSSLAAGSDIAISTTATLKLANVVSLRALCTVAGTINAVVKFVAAGTP